MKRRPPLYWKSWLIAGPVLLGGLIVLVVNGLVWVALAGALAALALYFGPWLLSPYSKPARRLAWPTAKDMERGVRVADWLGSVPVFGVVWRWLERLSGNAGRRQAEEYQRWQREHDDEWPQ